jgi:CheY-like chemotaxis protein
VLLVEDNPVNQLVAKGMLGQTRLRCRVAAHGAEALDQLEHRDSIWC